MKPIIVSCKVVTVDESSKFSALSFVWCYCQLRNNIILFSGYNCFCSYVASLQNMIAVPSNLLASSHFGKVLINSCTCLWWCTTRSLTNRPKLTLFSKSSDCSLCDDAKEALADYKHLVMKMAVQSCAKHFVIVFLCLISRVASPVMRLVMTVHGVILLLVIQQCLNISCS